MDVQRSYLDVHLVSVIWSVVLLVRRPRIPQQKLIHILFSHYAVSFTRVIMLRETLKAILDSDMRTLIPRLCFTV